MNKEPPRSLIGFDAAREEPDQIAMPVQNSAFRTRREASKRLGLELGKRYEKLVLAGSNPDAVSNAAVALGALFNENIEFVIWVLKEYGSVPQMPFQRRK